MGATAGMENSMGAIAGMAKSRLQTPGLNITDRRPNRETKCSTLATGCWTPGFFLKVNGLRLRR